MPVIKCVQCGKPVEHAREVYAIPTCYACLPPPEPLPVIPVPGIVERLRKATKRAPTWGRLKHDAVTDLITRLKGSNDNG